MSTETKVELVASAMDHHSLAAALAAVDLPRSTWYYHEGQKVDYSTKYARLQPLLETIAREHPEYGYRRTTAELREMTGEVINHKVVQRLHQIWGLSLLRTTRKPKPSGIRQVIVAAGERINLVAQLHVIEPLMVAYTDFTELPYAAGSQKAYLMPIVDHVSKVVWGWAVGEHANRLLALKAWRRSQTFLEGMNIGTSDLILHHDQDSVYTSYDWTGQLLLVDKVRLSYALDGAKDNPEMEAFFGRFKTENRSLFLDAPTIEALSHVVNVRMGYYNQVRRHSSLANIAPMTFLKHWLASTKDGKSSDQPVLGHHTKT